MWRTHAKVLLLALNATAWPLFASEAERHQTEFVLSDSALVPLPLTSTDPSHACEIAEDASLFAVPTGAAQLPSECKHCPCVDRRPGWPRKPLIKRPGDRNRESCPPKRYLMDDWCRAGCPGEVSKRAKVSTTWQYSGGYVGGGAALCGRGRKCSEGIWGVDYQFTKHTKLFLNWTCGRYQGGEGAYQTDEEGAVECLIGEKTTCACESE